MFEDSNSDHSTETDAGQELTATEKAGHVYKQLENMRMIAYGTRIPIATIRQLANIPAPQEHELEGLSVRDIGKIFSRDDLALLNLKDTIFTKYLMKNGMAMRKDGEEWVIPARHEMHRVWEGYARKAGNALDRARWLMRSAPAATGEDAAFAQSQAARVARRVAKLTEQAARVGQ